MLDHSRPSVEPPAQAASNANVFSAKYVQQRPVPISEKGLTGFDYNPVSLRLRSAE